MHLALTLAVGVLLVIQVQSQIPDVCQMHIKSFLSYIQQAAESIDKEKHSELYTKVSMLAKTVGDFIERKTAQKTGAVGISEKCKEARKKFAMELSSVHKEMKEANDSALSDAVEHIDLAIQFMQKMEDLRGLN